MGRFYFLRIQCPKMAEETVAEPPPPAPAAPEIEEAPKGVKACMDLTEFPIKNDYFEGMHMLPETVEKIESAPNFRQVNGFPVFGVGQPAEDGFVPILEKTKSSPEEKPGKILWFNFRKEPVVYINGSPYSPRDPADLHRNMNISHSIEELDHLERNLAEIVINKAQKSNQTLKVHKDLAFAENPMEREAEEIEVKVEKINGLQTVHDNVRQSGFEGLTVHRIPVTEERAPAEYCFDMILNILKDEPASVPCVFNDQQGRGRTTLGMVIACLIKEIQITSELRRMEEIELVSKDTVKDLIHQKFESALPKCQDDDDPFIKGEFDVIKELLEKFPATVEGKKKIDRVIDICGPTPEGPGGYHHSFSWWMEEHKEMRGMIDQGKDKLEWYRTVDAAKLEHLKDMMSAPNYKENLGTLIRTIYDFAFVTYADLPRGPIKNNSMRRLAATTLLDILPPDIADRVNKKMEEDPNGSHDFLTLVGLVSYYGADDD